MTLQSRYVVASSLISIHSKSLQAVANCPAISASSKGYANTHDVNINPEWRRLVADLLEVLAQLNYRGVGVGSLDGIGVVGDEERLCGLECDDAFFALLLVSTCPLSTNVESRKRTFFALRESSVDSMVMYFAPLILIPLEMTDLGSLLSLKEAAMALISSAVSWQFVSALSKSLVSGIAAIIPASENTRLYGADIRRSLQKRPR